jgi:hypothetical protein
MVEGLHAPLTRVPEGESEPMALDSIIIHPLHAPSFGIVKVPV